MGVPGQPPSGNEESVCLGQGGSRLRSGLFTAEARYLIRWALGATRSSTGGKLGCEVQGLQLLTRAAEEFWSGRHLLPCIRGLSAALHSSAHWGHAPWQTRGWECSSADPAEHSAFQKGKEMAQLETEVAFSCLHSGSLLTFTTATCMKWGDSSIPVLQRASKESNPQVCETQAREGGGSYVQGNSSLHGAVRPEKVVHKEGRERH